MGHDDATFATMTFQLAGQTYRAELRRAAAWKELVWNRDLQWVVQGAGRQWTLPGAGKAGDTADDLRDRLMWRLLPQSDPAWRPAPA
jgi:hypothetical protein